MESALHSLQQGNVGISILQETNMTEGIYMRYKLWTEGVEIRHRGGIYMVWRE